MATDVPTHPIDVDRARADTPGCDLVVHLNHAGASLVPRPVLDAQIEWLQAEALTGGYELVADREAEHRATYDERRSSVRTTMRSPWWRTRPSLGTRRSGRCRCGPTTGSLRARLAEVAGIRVHDLGRRRSGIVTFSVDGIAAEDVRDRLRTQGINVSVSEPSSTRLDAERRRLPPLVRASVHYVTTEAELDRLTGAVAGMALAS